jgi:hypothetical protein
MSPYAELEIALHTGPDAYTVELRFSHPDSDAELTPQRGPAALDLEELLSLQFDAVAYGRTLAAQLFHDEAVRTLYAGAKAVVEASGVHLRLRLAVGSDVPELHAVRWELLRDPLPDSDDAPLSTSERTPFSRFMRCRDWRHVRPRTRSEMTALVAVAAPPDVREGEIERSRTSLGKIPTTVIDEPVTLNHLVERLRDDDETADILYLVCHGVLTRSDNEPFLFLQNDDSTTARVAGAELAERVAELERPPRLVVLASCESAGTAAGTDAAGKPTAQSSLAPRLADAGVPAILAMQGRISMTTVEKLMPVFFRKLLEDGQIDRALAIARGMVRDRYDSWMPALYLRLKSGRLWTNAGFDAGQDRSESDDVKWKSLCRHVRGEKLVPILGSGVAEKVCLDASETARRLAEAHGFPFATHQRDDLPCVLQYLSVTQTPSAVQPELLEQLHRQILDVHGEKLKDKLRQAPLPKLMDAVGELRRQDPDEPHRRLAKLPARVYVTASYDNLLVRALQEQGRKPLRLTSRWREKPPIAAQTAGDPSHDKPAVYHVLGAFADKESLVLTEDDYFDYLIAGSNELIPRTVASELVDSSLLFLGFRLSDWSFRILFRLIMSFDGGERLKNYPHVAVQVDPAANEFLDAEAARRYFQDYFGDAAGIHVYWGTVEDFLEQLHDKLDTLPVEVATNEDDDAWD